ncbi:MAG: hypothetical protein ABIQ27_09020 [Flavobacterium sp.]|uniref:hypothetical protein n=1 Tax=Flavobacterium sp. TaxID=239 RepID=UPI0032667E3D
MKKSLHTLLLLFLTTLCFAQNDKPQRAAFKFKLAEDNLHYTKINVPQSDYFVKYKMLEIYATEKLNIEVTLQNDTIATMKVVKKIVYPERTIVIDFKQKHERGKLIGIMLNIKNPFDKKLVYDANMFLIGGDKWIPTNVIPVYPKIQSFESWPDPITTLCLCNWHFEK